jgi:hypothetical protein
LGERILVVGVSLGYLNAINPRMRLKALRVSGKHSNPVAMIQQLNYESPADVTGCPGYQTKCG